MEENADLRFKIKTLEEHIRLLESHIIALGDGSRTPCRHSSRNQSISSESSLPSNSLGATLDTLSEKSGTDDERNRGRPMREDDEGLTRAVNLVFALLMAFKICQ